MCVCIYIYIYIIYIYNFLYVCMHLCVCVRECVGVCTRAGGCWHQLRFYSIFNLFDDVLYVTSAIFFCF